MLAVVSHNSKRPVQKWHSSMVVAPGQIANDQKKEIESIESMSLPETNCTEGNDFSQM